MAKKIEAFECAHCKNIYRSERGVNKHEISCSKNPENDRHCFHCRHLCKKDLIYSVDLPTGGEENIKVNVLYCHEIESALYPPKVEIKKNAFDVLYDHVREVSNRSMPKTGSCLKFKSF